MSSKFLQLALLSGPLLLVASPGLAKSENEVRPASIESWVEQVNTRIDRVIDGPRSVEGTASASFRRGDDGRVADLRIVAATPALNMAVRTTLARLGSLPEMPIGVDPNQVVRVRLMFGGQEDESRFRAKREAMLTAARTTNRRLAMRLTARPLAMADHR